VSSIVIVTDAVDTLYNKTTKFLFDIYHKKNFEVSIRIVTAASA
jgi:hypothetical protein